MHERAFSFLFLFFAEDTQKVTLEILEKIEIVRQ